MQEDVTQTEFDSMMESALTPQYEDQLTGTPDDLGEFDRLMNAQSFREAPRTWADLGYDKLTDHHAQRLEDELSEATFWSETIGQDLTAEDAPFAGVVFSINELYDTLEALNAHERGVATEEQQYLAARAVALQKRNRTFGADVAAVGKSALSMGVEFLTGGKAVKAGADVAAAGLRRAVGDAVADQIKAQGERMVGTALGRYALKSGQVAGRAAGIGGAQEVGSRLLGIAGLAPDGGYWNAVSAARALDGIEDLDPEEAAILLNEVQDDMLSIMDSSTLRGFLETSLVNALEQTGGLYGKVPGWNYVQALEEGMIRGAIRGTIRREGEDAMQYVRRILEPAALSTAANEVAEEYVQQMVTDAVFDPDHDPFENLPDSLEDVAALYLGMSMPTIGAAIGARNQIARSAERMERMAAMGDAAGYEEMALEESEMNAFRETGAVSPDRAQNIAQKLAAGMELTDDERLLHQSARAEVDQYLEDASKMPEPTPDQIEAWTTATEAETAQAIAPRTLEQRAAVNLARMFGQTLFLMDTVGGHAAGMRDPGTGALFLNANEANPLAVAVHELGHSVKEKLGETEFNRVMAQIEVRAPGFLQYAGGQWRQRAESSDRNADAATLDAEQREESFTYGAEIASSMILHAMTPEGRADLQWLAEREPGFLRTMVDALEAFLSTVTGGTVNRALGTRMQRIRDQLGVAPTQAAADLGLLYEETYRNTLGGESRAEGEEGDAELGDLDVDAEGEEAMPEGITRTEARRARRERRRANWARPKMKQRGGRRRAQAEADRQAREDAAMAGVDQAPAPQDPGSPDFAAQGIDRLVEPSAATSAQIADPSSVIGAGLTPVFSPKALPPKLQAKTKEAGREGLKLTKKFGAPNVERNLDVLDEVESAFPNPLKSRRTWHKFIKSIFGSDESVQPPKRLLDFASKPTLLVDHLRDISDEQVRHAEEGLELTRKIRARYAAGEMGAADSGEIFVWAFLSRMLSAAPHESAFLMAHDNGIRPFIERVADGEWTAEDAAEYEAWLEEWVPSLTDEQREAKWSGEWAASARSNLNAIGRTFFPRMAEARIEGQPALQVLHQMLADPETSGADTRRAFSAYVRNSGMQTKLVSFVALVAGKHDVFVIDRWQARNMWAQFTEVDPYDGVPQGRVDKSGKPVTGGVAQILDGPTGIAIYEALERGMRESLEQAYGEVGRTPDVGRYHWESWLWISAQEVGHASLRVFSEGGSAAGLGVVEGRQGRQTFGDAHVYLPSGDRGYVVVDSHEVPRFFEPQQYQQIPRGSSASQREQQVLYVQDVGRPLSGAELDALSWVPGVARYSAGGGAGAGAFSPGGGAEFAGRFGRLTPEAMMALDRRFAEDLERRGDKPAPLRADLATEGGGASSSPSVARPDVAADDRTPTPPGAEGATSGSGATPGAAAAPQVAADAPRESMSGAASEASTAAPEAPESAEAPPIVEPEPGDPQDRPRRVTQDDFGRPELGNPFETPESQHIQDIVDNRMGIPDRQADEMLKNLGERIVRDNYDAARYHVEKKINEGEILRPAEQWALLDIIDRLFRQGQRGSLEAHADSIRLRYAYRDQGSAIGRLMSMRARRGRPRGNSPKETAINAYTTMPPKERAQYERLRKQAQRLMMAGRTGRPGSRIDTESPVMRGPETRWMRRKRQEGYVPGDPMAGAFAPGEGTEDTTRPYNSEGQFVGDTQAQAILDKKEKLEEADFKRKLKGVEAANHVLRTQPWVRAHFGTSDVNQISSEDLFAPTDAAYALAQAHSKATSTLDQKAIEFWLNSVLSGPKTQAVNITGNALMAGMQGSVDKLGQSIVNAGLAALKLGPQDAKDATNVRELGWWWKGFSGAFTDASKAFMRAMKYEVPSLERSLAAQGVDLDHYAQKVENLDYGPKIKNFPMSILRRFGTTALAAFDDFFKTLVYRAESYSVAMRAAHGEGLRGAAREARAKQILMDYSNDAHMQGIVAARRATFQEQEKHAGRISNKVVNMAQQTRDLLNNLTPGLPIPLGVVTIAFTRTPVNIYAAFLRKTPLQLIGMAVEALPSDKTDGVGGYVGQRQKLVRDTADALQGLALAFVVASMVDDEDEDGRPFITGSGASHRGKREAQYRMAGGPNRIRVGDTYYDYGRLEPFGTAVSGMVDMLEALWAADAADEDVATAAALELVSSAFRQAKDKTFLQGIGDLMEIMEGGYSGDASGRAMAAKDFLRSGYITPMVPNVIRQPMRETDDVLRQRRTLKDDPALTWAVEGMFPVPDSPIDRAVGAEPKMPRVDLWGREITRAGTRGMRTDFLHRLINPLRPTPVPEAEDVRPDVFFRNYEQRALRGEVEGKVYYPSAPSRSFTMDGEQLRWTQEEYHTYLTEAGQAAFKRVSSMIDTGAISLDEPSDRHMERVKKVIRDERRKVRDRLRRERKAESQ